MKKLPTLLALADMMPAPRQVVTRTPADLTRIERAKEKRDRKNKRRLK